MYCANCGAACSGGSFCPNCGAPVYNELHEWYRPLTVVRQLRPYVDLRRENYEREMKSAFSRGGLGVLTLYGSFSLIGTVFVTVTVIFLMLNELSHYGYNVGSVYSSDLLQSPAGLFAVLSYIVGIALGMLLGIFFMKKILKKINPEAPQKRGLTGKEFLLALLFSFGAWGLGVILGNFPSLFYASDGTDAMLYDMLGNNLIPFYIYTILGAPVFEELALRKVLCGGLSKFGKAPAIIVSALLFGLIHGNSGQFFLAFFTGLVFGCVYLYSGKIWYTMVLHGIINITASLPQLFALGNIDISLLWYIAAGVMTVAGLLTLYLCRNHPMLHPAPSKISDCNKAVFSNTGMKIVVIAGLVLAVITDLYICVMNLIATRNPLTLLALIPTAITVTLVILTVKRSCRGQMRRAV